jgi:uncharacterized damage-inducible protein DinB
MTTPNELQRLLLHNAAFTPPPRIVAGVPAASRIARPDGVPHSIAEELWHVVYWQDLFLGWARAQPLAYPARAEEGWRTIDALADIEWDDLVRRFETGLVEAAEFAGKSDLHQRRSALVEPDAGLGPPTLFELLANLAVHNAYHLGRLVQLRQMVGCWPPPGGGDTW